MNLTYKSVYVKPIDNNLHSKKVIQNHSQKVTACSKSGPKILILFCKMCKAYDIDDSAFFKSQYFNGPIVKPYWTYWTCKVRKRSQTGPQQTKLMLPTLVSINKYKKSINFTGCQCFSIWTLHKNKETIWKWFAPDNCD